MNEDKVTLGVFEHVTKGDVEQALLDVVKGFAPDPARVGMTRRQIKDGTILKSMYDVFLDDARKGCFVSVKVPVKATETGQALHLNVRYMFDPENDFSINVFPEQKEGRGHFWSKSIHRTASQSGRTSWKDRLSDIAKEGMDLCVTRFGSVGRDFQTIMSELGLSGIPLRFVNVDSGKYSPSGYCDTKSEASQQVDTCKNALGYRADQPLNKTRHYVVLPKDLVSDYDRVTRGEVYVIPPNSCQRTTPRTGGNPYMGCKITSHTSVTFARHE